MRQVFPQFAPLDLPKLQSIEGLDWMGAALDLMFCALPHATTQKVVQKVFGELPQGATDSRFALLSGSLMLLLALAMLRRRTA